MSVHFSTRSRSRADGVTTVVMARLGQWLGGRWMLEEKIGRGGASSVFSAIDRGGVRAAIKVLDVALAGERVTRARFLREAYVASRIGHPGAVRVLEDGVADDGAPYLVMELLRGENLETRRTRHGGRLPVEEVVWLADRALGVLAAAHARGIVHRDVKPEHLFLTMGNELKLLDFGIAHLKEQDSPDLTGAGAVLGTVAFMAPEQARGEAGRVGPQADLWALGATLYTLLSGVLPRDDGSLRVALRSAAREPIPSLAEVAPFVPREIVDVVDFALALDPRTRWPNAPMMQRTLRRAYVRVWRSSERAFRLGATTDEVEDSEVGLDFDTACIPLHAPPAPPASE
jgi:serine/threonine-protein kinase